MPDTRRAHIHYPPGPSLLNVPNPVFEGAARSLYGSRGPQQAQNTGRQRKPLQGPPESIQHHVDDALAHVADLTGRQKAAVKTQILRMMNDITFLRQLTADARARGPWSQAAVDHSEGTLPPY
jgi:hypothetical protein